MLQFFSGWTSHTPGAEDMVVGMGVLERFFLPASKIQEEEKEKYCSFSPNVYIIYLPFGSLFASTSHTLDRSTFSSFPYVFINLFYCFYLHLSCFFFLISIPLLAYSYLLSFLVLIVLL